LSKRKKGKDIPVTGHRGPLGCETSSLPHFLENRFTDGGEVVRLVRQRPFIPRKIPGTHFCQRLSRPQGHSAAGRIMSIKNATTSSGIEPANFRPVTQCLNKRSYHVPQGKNIHVTGCRGPYSCETSRLQHFLDNRFTDGDEVVRLVRQRPFNPRKIPGTHFCQRLSRPQGHSAAGRIRLIKKSKDVIGNLTRDLF
jgi:hypothetical protein